MNRIREALTRKIGPLPAWVYAVVGGVGLYWWRNRTARDATTTTGQVVDSTQSPGDPVTLAPGESVYDPSTGHLTGSPTGELSAGQPPVTLDPGQGIYDPNTGTFIQNPDTSANNNATNAAATQTGGKKGKPRPGTPSTNALLKKLEKKHSAAYIKRIVKILRSRGVGAKRIKAYEKKSHSNAKPAHARKPKVKTQHTKPHTTHTPTRARGPVKVRKPVTTKRRK